MKSRLHHCVTCISIILIIAFTSCISDKSLGPIGIDSTIPNLTHSGVWITNEGGFTFGQASLSFLDLVEDSMYNNVFQAINNRPLGDVLQSLSYYKGKAYLVLNNSQKIEVVDSITFISIATINDLNTPRELIGHHDKLFVSDLYSNELTVLNANNYNVIKVIETGGWTNKMLVYENKLFVTVQQTFINNVVNSKKGIMVVDMNTLEEIAFIPLAQGANSLQLDKNQNLWVLCDGGLEEELGGLFRVDPINLSLELSINFPTRAYSANSLLINDAKDRLYYIISDPNEGINAYDIKTMDIDETVFSFTKWFDGGQLYIYGLLINEDRNEFYFTDAVGLIQEGFCYKYKLSDKSLINKYETGIFPSQLYLN